MPIDNHDPIQTTTKRMTIETDYATVNTQTDTTPTNAAVGLPTEVPLGKKYIGARYVPLFADPFQWDINTTYEPLTIVSNEGNSYTSKQYVPAGIDISDEDYWALTGNYNAQIEAYRQEVQGVSTQISELSGEVDAVKADVEGVKTSMSELEATVEGDIQAETKLSAARHGQSLIAMRAWDRRAIVSVGSGVTDDNASSGSESFRYYFDWRTKQLMFMGELTVGDLNLVAGSTIGTIDLKPGATVWLKNFMSTNNAANPISIDATLSDTGIIYCQGTVPSGSKLHINYNGSANWFGGDFEFPEQAEVNAAAIQLACTTFMSWQGKFDYSTNVLNRLNVAQNATDCSGCIHNAFKAAGVEVPAYGNSQAAYGRVIAYAAKGEQLDVSQTKAGDVLCYVDDDFQTCHHVALFVSQGVAWEQDTAFDNGEEKGPQPLSNPATSLMTKNERYIVRWFDA